MTARPTVSVCVVHHSGYGHTERMAAAVVEGVCRVAGVHCKSIPVAALEPEQPAWDDLDDADAIIFGAPTYMGNVSAAMKRFMENSSSRWMQMRWADKLAAGFTNSGSWNGDKHNTLVALPPSPLSTAWSGST